MSTQEPTPTLICLREATKLLPSHRPGRTVHIETLYRWIRQGRLRGWRRGDWWFVAKEDVLAMAREVRPTPAVQAPKRRMTRAIEILKRAGIA